MYSNNDIEAFIFTHNQQETIEDSIVSIVNQSIGQVKITVIDNDCTDKTVERVNALISKYPQISYVKSNTYLNQLDLIKKASELTCAEFVILFHGDDVLHPDYLNYAINAINKYPNTAIVSSCYQEWSNPTNNNWAKAPQRFDYCSDKKAYINYLYRMQRGCFPATIYKTENLKKHIYDNNYYAQYGTMMDKPFVANTMTENNSAIIFRSKKLVRYRIYAKQDTDVLAPNYNEIIAYNKYFKPYMQDCWYSKLMYNIINYKQLVRAYEWGRDYTISETEFIKKAINEGAGSEYTKLCILPIIGKVFVEIAHIARKFLKTHYKRIFRI